MRTLKRGARGEDVLLWQQFLGHLRGQPPGGIPPLRRVDGIFGSETEGATQAFQRLNHLPPDGVVGPATYRKARELGFLDDLHTTPESEGIAPILRPLSDQIKAEPILEGDCRRASAPAPKAGRGPGREESFRRLRAEAWKDERTIKDALREDDARFQLLKDGSGDYVYDEYAVVVDMMPPGKTAPAFLADLAGDLNGTVADGDFDTINVFTRRNNGTPKLGEIIDIDILGPVNGSVVLVESTESYFIFQTVTSKAMGSHPENGCREFGFEPHGNGVLFYTRGVSRPGDFITRIVGAIPQQRGWTSLMMGISARITKLGGRSNKASFRMYKENRSQ